MSENSVTILLGFMSVAGVVLAAWLARKIPASQRADVISIQGKTLADAFDEIRELRDELRKSEREIQELQRDVRKFKNGYARAIRYIYEKDPNAEIPNFLIDTNDTRESK